jgi:putative membrane protein
MTAATIPGVPMFDPVFNNLAAFASFFATAVALLLAFLAIYVRITPYNELTLIREGNTAAAVSLAGAVIGFALPIAVSVAVSHSLYAMLAWGGIASAVQLLTFIAARLALPRLNESIPQGKVASGIFLASLAIGVGILNAGCIV